MPSKVNNATFRSHGYNGIFRITHIASHCTGKPLFLVPLRASVAQRRPRGFGARKNRGAGCWKYERDIAAYQRSRVLDKRVTSGPFTQNAFVRPDILIPMPTQEKRNSGDSGGGKDRYTHRHSVKSPVSCAILMPPRDFSLSLLSIIHHGDVCISRTVYAREHLPLVLDRCEIHFQKYTLASCNQPHLSFRYIRGFFPFFFFFLLKGKKNCVYIELAGFSNFVSEISFE